MVFDGYESNPAGAQRTRLAAGAIYGALKASHSLHPGGRLPRIDGRHANQEPAREIQSLSAALAAATALALPVTGFGVEPELNIPNFSHLKLKATESVDVTLDGFLMRIAAKVAASQAADEAHDNAISLLQDIKSVRVRNFTFDSDNAYSKADIDSVRKQLQDARLERAGPGPQTG